MWTAVADERRRVSSDAGMLSFNEALQQQLSLLRNALGFKTWLLSRRVGDRWIVVEALGGRPPVRRGWSMAWTDTLCCRALEGQIPAYCPDLSALSEYSKAPARALLHARAYWGVGISRADGRLFGTLVGLDPAVRDPSSPVAEATLRETAQTIATLIERECRIAQGSRLATYDALRDQRAAGVLQREDWDELLSTEEAWRTLLFAPVTILAAALPRVTPVSLKVLQRTLGDQGMVVQWSETQVLALLPDCEAASAAQMQRRLEHGLAAAGVPARIRTVQDRDPTEPLQTTTLRVLAALKDDLN